MREHLTDEMILENMTTNPLVLIVLGVLGIALAGLIWYLLKKSPKYRANSKYLVAILPFAFFGIVMLLMGVDDAVKGDPTMDDFVVRESVVLEKYREKQPGDKRKADGAAEYYYYLVLEGFDKDLRVEQYRYYHDYEEGDKLYVIVKPEDYNSIIRVYSTDEFEYVGEKLIP